MRSYIEMSTEEGRKFLPSVRNLFFKPLTDEDFFVEPWRNRELADCAEFRLDGRNMGRDEVLFFVSDEEIINFLKRATEEIYLFGAYNLINVCQMRARGNVRLAEDHPEKERVKHRRRAAIEAKIDADRLSETDVETRYALLDTGRLLCLRISAYAYRMYERG